MTRPYTLVALAALAALSSASRAARHDPNDNACRRSPTSAITPRFSAHTLRQGRFSYREHPVANPGDTSTFTLEIRRRVDGDWRFTGDGSGQHWESLADSVFHPRSAMLSLVRRGRPYRMELRYTADSVFATELGSDASGAPLESHTAAPISQSTIDQRIDWASLMASDLAEGHRASYHVYDPATGTSDLSASAARGPALRGARDSVQPTVKLDYVICKAGRAESYTVYTTTERPRTMLREDLRGNVISELIRVEP